MSKIYYMILPILLLSATIGLCEEPDVEVNNKFLYNDHGKRNPFWELLDSSGNVINYGSDIMVDDMLLEGIMMGSSGNSIAIINGDILQKNGKIGEFTILDIQPDAVILIKDNKKFQLRLKKED